MFDDASFYTFMPSAHSQEEKAQVAKHTRKQSLLIQPNDDSPADADVTDNHDNIVQGQQKLNSPPEATLIRRAQSYSDFHDAVRAVLGQSNVSSERGGSKIQKDINSDLDFVDCYNGFEQDLLEASHDDYTQYHEQLDLTHSHLDSLLESTNSALGILTSLSDSFRSVEVQTTEFQGQCEGLLSEQSRLTDLAHGIWDNLQYYSYLEPITRKLNAPGAGNFVRGKDFSDMLARLDECLEYMLAQREASTYRSRYRLLMTRALTLIRVNFVSTLREVAADVTKRIADGQLKEATTSALLYSKFRVGAAELREVGQEIQKRTVVSVGAEPGAEAEYQNLMNELHTNYASTRGKLVIPLLRKRIGEIAIAPATAKDLVAFARSSIGYIKGVCSDEHELWHEWFEGDLGLYQFLELVCEPLFDHLRPRILHETQLLKLCELCILLQTRYVRDQDDDAESVDGDQVNFSALIQPALEDAQTRLVFRALAILRDEIERYRPKPEDLKYPIRRRQPAKGSNGHIPVTSGKRSSIADTANSPPIDYKAPNDIGSVNSNIWDLDTEGIYQGWYPTLRKAIWLLSRIYRLVNSTVFDDLAHQIVHQTTLSLHQAATQISTNATNADGQLFLIKHLLILKQQIVAFDIEYVTPDISFDFSGVTNTFWELRERGGLFDIRSLWRLVGGGLLPRVVENMLDAKVELDGRLRTVITEFTGNFASRMTGAISESAVRKKDFNGGLAVAAIQEASTREVPLLRKKLDEYLNDTRTKETLVGAVQDQLIQTYETFCERHQAAKRLNGKAVSKKGKGREDDIWDVDTLHEWSDSIFKVIIIPGEDGLDDGRSRSISRNGSI